MRPLICRISIVIVLWTLAAHEAAAQTTSYLQSVFNHRQEHIRLYAKVDQCPILINAPGSGDLFALQGRGSP
jgi:hypothetical protein